jgi:ankyrin repeat protein
MSFLDSLPEDLQREICQYFDDEEIDQYSPYIFQKVLHNDDVFWSERLKYYTPVKITKRDVYEIMALMQNECRNKQLLKYKFHHGFLLEHWDIEELVKDEEFLRQQNKVVDKNLDTLLVKICRDKEYFRKYFDILINNGADINIGSINTPLICAVKSFDVNMIKRILEAGADVNRKNDNGDTALFYVQNNVEILKILVNAGANINMQDSEGYPILYYNICCEESLKFLIKSGININLQNKNGQTVLHLVILRHVSFMSAKFKLFIEAGADINIPDSNGMTPAALALSRGYDLNKL